MIKTMDLHHGTSHIPPDLIYTYEESFDMRFTPRGMWGTAIYFSANASYSNEYAYHLPNG